MGTDVLQPRVIEANEVRALVSDIDAVAVMRDLFADLAAGQAVQPAQSLTLLPNDAGDFITYLGASAGAQVFGAKLSPYLPRPEGPVITAWTLLMSAQTGRPLMLCDSGELTTLRTAATTALAVDLLARPEARRLALIGAGRVAQAHLHQVLALRDWADIRIHAPSLSDPAKRPDWIAGNPAITVAASAEEAASEADVILLCTSSGTPVIASDAIPACALVTSISTNVANAHEVSPSFLAQTDVYCDYKLTTPGAAGEMKLAAQEGWSADAIRGDLADLVGGTATPPSGERPVFFRSIGLGLEDIFMAYAVYTASRR